MRRAAKRCANGCARRLRRELPGTQVSFEAADIVTQVMSFGSPTPIEVAVQGVSLQNDYAYAQKVQGAVGEARASCAICNSRRRTIIRRWTSTSTASAPASSA